MSDQSTTHLLEIGTELVVKRYRSWEYRQPEREWTALQLLDEHAPGTAPTPVSADLSAVLPVVVMSRLPGLPLPDPVGTEHAAAVARTVVHVQEAIPRTALAELPPRAGRPAELLQQVTEWCVEASSGDASPLAAKALAAGSQWLQRPDLAARLSQPGTPVFGTGDGNLANYLWDGSEARLVDFEYSGRSDRAYELAEMIEHISVRQRGGTAVVRALEHVAPEEHGSSRFADCRRLHAFFWLLRILGSGQGRSTDGSPVLISQATRVLELLG
ncbi:aminoglycoside phosphotransferase family protein [Actinomadura sp. NAK00032]|uniref:phosphotransferase family protein n=1 Tax=Actinomadura sp. NAK00032 TaxID=2742128 RepID=UPI0015928363|nr:aminoglycoside phosphotransferase family protein [Actinomadura sp. NAK00032]QKW37955.1 aminoglycoside phosphotransferase family protein [Actinomadura sp. NAK00032]